MKLLTSVCCLVVALTTVGVATSQDADQVKEEMKRFEGTWIPVAVETFELKGEKKDITDPKVLKVFAFRIKVKDGKFLPTDFNSANTKVIIDPTKTPKTMDLVNQKDETRTRKLIYKLDGDTLRICFNSLPDGYKDRPTEFKSDGALITLLLKRDKQEKQEKP